MQIQYKDFIAEISYISRTGCFYGEVINCSDVIIFHAEHNKDLQELFCIAVEQYLFYISKLLIVDSSFLGPTETESGSVITESVPVTIETVTVEFVTTE